jgi:hypothetical protein
MSMLRDFMFNQGSLSEVIKELERFDLGVSQKEDRICLLKFEFITPDSFMWRILIKNKIYYLYAEDYIPSLEHVKNVISTYTQSRDWVFVPPREVKNFQDTSPVRGAAVYNEPIGSADIMQVSVDSGHDFVFLALSTENTEDAYFSETAPLGFTLN